MYNRNGVRLRFDATAPVVPARARTPPAVIDLTLGDSAQEESSEEEISLASSPAPAQEESTADNEFRSSRVGLPIPRDFTRDHHQYFSRDVYFRMPSAQDLFANQMSSKHNANR